MEVDVIDAGSRLALEPGRVEVGDVLHPGVEEIERIHGQFEPRCELPVGLRIDDGGRARADAVVLDQRARSEIAEEDACGPAAEIVDASWADNGPGWIAVLLASAEAVLALGERAETTEVIRLVPTPIDYWVCTTFQRERMYRNYFLSRDIEKPLFESYRELARLFPKGLAETQELPEEGSGSVKSAWRDRGRVAQ